MEIKINIIEVDKSIVMFLAVETLTGLVVGKCSIKFREKKTIRYQEAEVPKKYRGKGIYSLLFSARERYIKQKGYSHWKIESYCKESTLNLFLKHGFKISDKLYLVERSVLNTRLKAV